MDQIKELQRKIDVEASKVMEAKRLHYTGERKADKFAHFEQQNRTMQAYFSDEFSEYPVLRAIQWNILKHLTSIDLLLQGIGELSEAVLIEKIGDASNYFRIAFDYITSLGKLEDYTQEMKLFFSAFLEFRENSEQLIEKFVCRDKATDEATDEETENTIVIDLKKLLNDYQPD